MMPDLCLRLYMGACTERKLDDVRLARLVLRIPITAVLSLSSGCVDAASVV